MERILLNTVSLNSVSLNLVGSTRKRAGGGGGPDVPSGYETFNCSDGAFEASDGEFYVKI